MASVVGEALLGKACEMVLEMAVQKLSEQANLVVNFREEFRWLKRKLTFVRGFLRDADRQAPGNENVKEWLEVIRVISFLAEDIVEECVVDSLYGNSGRSCGLCCNQWIYRWRMGRRIKDIKDRIRSVIEDGNELKLLHEVFPAPEAASAPSTSQSAEWKRSNLPPTDSHPVGIQSKVDAIIRLLDDNAFPVIAVVGMGGMGKTYLLQHVYNTIRERYDISIWLSVSQSYSVSNLQKILIFHINRDLSEEIKYSEVNEEVAIAPLIREKLEGKRCLVVLDDVWRAEREYDLLARLGLPTGNNSPCKIVVTTRNREVCTNLNAQIYEMQYLSDEESWKLFCVYAFGDREPPKHLEEVGHKIVKQCGNLPLAIRTIGASLAKTRVPSEWESKLHQLQGVSAADVDRIMPILSLSYDSLSARLKACFAYLSFFPEDEKIECEYLVNLWIGEGFIPAGEGQLDVARDCLYQLENLCLIQVWWEGITEILTPEPLVQYCRVHDLLLDLAIQVSRENRCGFSLHEVSQNSNGDWCRILLGKKGINDDAISEMHPVCLRTFSSSQNRGITSIPTDLFTAMRGLRVLDLSTTSITELPESIGKMKLLKVLNLRDTDISEVPECVRHLKSLLFLALSRRCEELPVWINEVKCLRHIECQGVSRMPRGVSQLVSLRTLRSDALNLSLNDDGFMKPEDLASMTQLQELWLNVNHELVKDEILPQLVNMRHLQIWNKQANGEDAPSSNLELSQKMTAMQQLESLQLWHFAVPSWICDLVNLRELGLDDCEFSVIAELQKIPNLVSLQMCRNLRCRTFPEWFGKAGGFPCLRFLTILHFSELEEFPELEEGAMAFLERFYLIICPKVKKVGAGLERLKRLQRFSYSSTGTDQVKDAFQKGGEYWHRIKAINPHVSIDDSFN